MILKLLLFIHIFLLCACTSINSQEKPLRAAVISVKYHSIPIKKGASFKWEKDHIRLYHDPRLDQAQIDRLLKKAIEQELITKGYRYRSNDRNTDFIIAYAAALKSSLSNDQLQQQYGLHPGYIEKNSDSEQHEKGTVVFDIIDPNSDRLVWRSAGQAMATVKQIPENERQQRIKEFIRQLLQELPQAVE